MHSQPLHNANKAWTAADCDTLNQMLVDGKTLEQICRHLGRTASAIISKAQVLNSVVQNRVGYYVLSPDPFASWDDVRHLDRLLREEANAPL